MKSFLKEKLKNLAVSNGLVALLTRTAKEEGKEVGLEKLEVALVEKLTKSSIITSATASCAIEGINVAETKILAISEKRTSPKKREEYEVMNYKAALEFIYNSDPASLRPTPELIRRLHSLSMAATAGAGEFKTRDNLIIEATESGDKLRFTPLSAKETEAGIDSLCLGYNNAIDKETAAPQICVAAFILDFTCIHPFADGNGRVSRLLTTAALLELGLKMPKLVSLEEITQNREDQYYAALALSSSGWHTGNHTLEPFIRFHLETLVEGYAELQKKIQRIKEPVTVIFAHNVPVSVRDKAFQGFKEVYENAKWKVGELNTGRRVTIENYSTNLEKETFEKLKHASRLAERCLQKAEKVETSGNEFMAR